MPAPRSSQRKYALAIAFGVVAGIVIGTITDNMALWLPIGAAAGAVYAVLVVRRRRS
jgi:uncharacterized membrane protein YoaK (UPF0700 family)